VPSSIIVTPPSPVVQVGKTLQLKATGKYSDGSSRDLTSQATWTPASPTVATVAAGGVATGVAANPGALTIYAANPGKWGNNLRVSVTVSSIHPTRFALSVQDPTGSVLESYANLSTDPLDSLGLYVVNVIDNDSQYVTFVNPASPGVTPSAPAGTPSTTLSPAALFGGADGTALSPGTDGNFETALGTTPVGGAPYGATLLDNVSIFNLLCVPGETDGVTNQALQAYCYQKRAFYIVDAPQNTTYQSLNGSGPVGTSVGGSPVAITGAPNAGNSAFYFPWVYAPDPLSGNRSKLTPPCGFVAGLYAKTDANRGVWKAPAGIDAALTGTLGLQYVLSDLQNGDLNHQAVNCLREFKVYGDVVWGARTLLGNDEVGSEWKYISIRRLALFIETSLLDGTQWVVFEPNDEPLWSQIRLNVGVFMNGLFRQGAFQGSTPQQAYFVKCDSENNPQSSIDQGIVNILVGFAPLYPAEFVVIQIQQMAGQLQS
jgi:phage tail sheath protein FI